MTRIFEANTARVVYDTIDGEVVAIRNDTGAYYSMTGTAASIWCALAGGLDTGAAAELVAAHHGLPASSTTATVTLDVEAFAERLVTAELIVAAEPSPEMPRVELPPETAGLEWTEPELQEFNDMADLLLFDPIHEVSPEGWPNVVEDSRRPA